jgi:nucleoside-diphosphate-sugar epimerase
MLLERGCQVRILTRGSFVSDDSRVGVVQGDIRDRETIDQLLENTDALFHCAAEFSQQELIWDINVKATEILIGEAKARGINYFCYISSAGVLGANSDLWVDENTPCHPRNLYEKSKYAAEHLVMSSGLKANVCVLRPVFVVSAQRPGFIDYSIKDTLMDKMKVLFKGKEYAHIVHAKDVAAAAVFFLDKSLPKPECYFVSCDEDDLNTVAGIVGYYRFLKKGKVGEVKLPISLPRIFPHLIRRIVRGPSLHGRTRFSSAKIRKAGFKFPLGFRGAVSEIVEQKAK